MIKLLSGDLTWWAGLDHVLPSQFSPLRDGTEGTGRKKRLVDPDSQLKVGGTRVKGGGGEQESR